MDKQKQQQIEELIGIIQGAVGGCATYWASLIAEEVLKYYQPKIPENAVVLTREEYEELQTGQDFNYGYHNGETNMTEYYENIRLPEVRKETAEKFAERVKMAFYYEFDELIPSIMADKIDEICKEITEGNNAENGE